MTRPWVSRAARKREEAKVTHSSSLNTPRHFRLMSRAASRSQRRLRGYYRAITPEDLLKVCVCVCVLSACCRSSVGFREGREEEEEGGGVEFYWNGSPGGLPTGVRGEAPHHPPGKEKSEEEKKQSAPAGANLKGAASA